MKKVTLEFENQTGCDDIDENFENKIRNAFQDNIERYLVNFQREIRANTYRVMVYLYPDSDTTFSIHAFVSFGRDTKNKQEFSMCYESPKIVKDYNDYFINDFTIQQLENLVIDMYSKNEYEICFVGKRMKSFEDYKKEYAKLAKSKMFKQDSLIYIYERECHNFIKNFMDAKIKKFISRTHKATSSFYIIDESNKIQIGFTDSSVAKLLDIETNKFYDKFEHSSENELLDYFAGNGFLDKDIVNEYKAVRDLNALVNMSKLFDY